MNTELYQELIIDHGTNPRNFQILSDPDYQAEGYNPLCGDQISLFLAVKDNLITKANFQGQGCAISTASASIMTEVLIGKNIEQSISLLNNFINCLTCENNGFIDPNLLPNKLLALLGVKNYPARVKCATLAWHTLNNALIK